MNLRNKIKTIITIALIIIVIGYSLFVARNFIRGPVLYVEYPSSATSSITIKGNAPTAKFISLNDLPITIDEKGNFSEVRLLESGYNVYKLFIKDKFNRTNQKILRIYRQDSF